MDGKELFSRTILAIQEMYLKIGEPSGSVSLYYPFDGDAEGIIREFSECTRGSFPGLDVEVLPQRLRVIVSERDCVRRSNLPIKPTMIDVISLVNGRVGIDEFQKAVSSKYPDATFRKSGNIDFDWVLIFPEDVDDDVYCISEEMGQVTFHRFSREEYLNFGYML